MRLYFSGLDSKQEVGFLQAAGVEYVLADLPNLANMSGFSHQALDSGAYRAYKKKPRQQVDVREYATDVHHLLDQGRQFDFIVSADVIGDAEQTRRNFRFLRDAGLPVMPVWTWGGELDDLERYFEDATYVGIGGLVNQMRDKDTRNEMLDDLQQLCWLYPGTFHLFGISWLHAIEVLKSSVVSGDTSKFMDGGRYGDVIFKHTEHGHLMQYKARAMKQYAHLDRAGRCIESARALRDFCTPLGTHEQETAAC